MLRFLRFLLGGRRATAAASAAIVPASQSSSTPAHEAFTPTQPCNHHAMLVGREREIDVILQSLTEDRAHVVLFSERGWGKTSLANVVVESLRRDGRVVARTQCEAASTFDAIVRGLVRSLPVSLLATPVRADALEGCEAALPARPVGPEDLMTLLSKLRARSLICVIDEFDRVIDPPSRTMLADGIKQLSDRAVPILFLIIGVSDNLDLLLGQHPSIQRNLVAVGLPLLSDGDVVALVERAAAQARLTFPAGLVAEVAAMSRGMPYMAHLLGLRTAQAAARRSASTIEKTDLLVALSRLASETPPRIVSLYEELTAGGQDHSMSFALRELATSAQDRWGRMQLVETSGDTIMVGGKRIANACMLKLCEAGALRLSGGMSGHVAFSERTLLHYVLIKAVEQDQEKAATPSIESGERRTRQLASLSHPTA